jgi:hypothetical protein
MRHWLGLILLLAACSTPVPDVATDEDAALGAPDSTIDVKKDVKDALADVQPVSDIAQDSDADSNVVPICQFPGTFGCKCKQDDDCDNQICIDGYDGKVCTKLCGDCPTDWKCVQHSAIDPTYICIPAFPKLCMPCLTHKDCQTNGWTDSFCLPSLSGSMCDQTQAGAFCGEPCSTVVDTCPTGYSCKTLDIFAGAAPVKQCVPDSGMCGCTNTWATEGKATMCVKTTAAGLCMAQRQCQFDANGKPELSACTAPTPATETCGDKVDNNCDGQTDETGAGGCTSWYPDNDGDGYGVGASTASNCLCNDPGPGYSKYGNDCDDLATQFHPGALEICNNVDDNCNGETDEAGSKGCTTLYHDLDGDGFGSEMDSSCLCKSKISAPWILQDGDCDDANAQLNPNASEICDGLDNNCNGKTDEQGAIGCKLYYLDADSDGFGVTSSGLCLCGASKNNAATQSGDCDDGNSSVNPVFSEICDSLDNDCNGATDDGSASATCVPGSTCTSGVCNGATCTAGTFELDGVAPACECTVSGGQGGKMCVAAKDLGDLPEGTTLTVSGLVLPDGSDGAWFRFQAIDSPDTPLPGGSFCDAYHVRVFFDVNQGGEFVFDVFRGSCLIGDEICTGETAHDWQTDFFGPTPDLPPSLTGTENKGECPCVPPNLSLPGANVCSNETANYFIRVRRIPGVAATCDAFTLRMMNGK